MSACPSGRANSKDGGRKAGFSILESRILNDKLDELRITLCDMLMIKSFKCADTEKVSKDIKVPKWESFYTAAQRKIAYLDTATSLHDLKSPGNQLEKLKKDRLGQWSIRINNQYRICFVWNDCAEDVEIVEYH